LRTSPVTAVTTIAVACGPAVTAMLTRPDAPVVPESGTTRPLVAAKYTHCPATTAPDVSRTSKTRDSRSRAPTVPRWPAPDTKPVRAAESGNGPSVTATAPIRVPRT
jgi:hypothetical protein